MHLILEFHNLKGLAHFDHAHLIIIKVTFLNLYQYAKNKLISSIHSLDKADRRVPCLKRLHLFLTKAAHKILK